MGTLYYLQNVSINTKYSENYISKNLENDLEHRLKGNRSQVSAIIIHASDHSGLSRKKRNKTIRMENCKHLTEVFRN